MNSSSHQTSLSSVILLGVAVITATGCALPGLGQKPVAPSSAAPTASIQQHQPANASVAAQQTSKTASPVQPVSFVGDGNMSGACVACETGDCNSCPTDATCQTNTGCVSCEPQACGPACQPMMMMPQPRRYDPQEFLCDGGDHQPEARLSLNDQILGLESEDTVTHYTTEAGDIEFSASNRVCVYAPRFGSVRQITGAVSGGNAIGVVKVDRPVGPHSVDLDLPGVTISDSLEVVQADMVRRVDAMRDRNRGVPLERVQQLELAADVMAALASIRNIGLGQLDDAELALLQRQSLAAVAWAIDESVEVEILDLAPPVLTRDQSVEELYVYDFPDAGRLNLMKFADKHDAAPGQEVGFMLRLQNVGDSAVSNIRITDNLTTRLAYVEDSQECSVDADFEEANNAEGSKQLLWTLLEPMEVGDVVTIRFTTTVR